MALHTKSIRDNIQKILTDHGVLQDLRNILEWKEKRVSAKIFSSGVALYAINQILGIGLLMIIGLAAIVQLLLYRLLLKMQTHGLISKGVDLSDQFVAVPESETIQTIVRVLLDVLRVTEDSVKRIALSRSLFDFVNAAGILIFVSILGTIVRLPELLIIGWICAFTMKLFV